MADTGYFDSVSANLKTGVGAQVKGISEGVKANSEIPLTCAPTPVFRFALTLSK